MPEFRNYLYKKFRRSPRFCGGYSDGMSMKRENGRVVIDISEDEFALLNYGLGTLGGTAKQHNQPALSRSLIKLANSINEGNSVWIPIDPGPEPEAPAVEGFAGAPATA